MFELGVTRVVVGTAAITDAGLVDAIGPLGKVAVGLDVRGREVAVRGWTAASGVDVLDAVGRFTPDCFIVTQIEVDGTHAGPDEALYRDLLAATPVDVVASGGVGTLDHVRALRDLRVGGRSLGGVIVGRALYDGAFTAAAAVACADGS